MLERLGPDDLRSAVIAYRDALRQHQEHLNRLNVYPVPDGDTGTNMALTLEAVVAELGSADDLASVCRAISHGSLMGARGNSGVILSQVLRGFTDSVKGTDALDAKAFAAAMGAASSAAYGAVMRPVEGTILTVVRESADAAARAEGSLAEVLEATVEAARQAVERTPELLPVLADAGVVDAGGAGFVLLLESLLQVVSGRPVPAPPAAASGAAAPSQTRAAGNSERPDVADLRYEVMYFLEAPDDAIAAFKEAWTDLGDSIVVVGGDGIWNCHIHTDRIGPAVEAALAAGRPRDIRVTDLLEQVDEEERSRDASRPAPDPVVTGVVAVAAGDGFVHAFRSMGARVVAGGQSMNPSTAEILDAVEATVADAVVVLPNNRNVVPAAEQVPPLATKPVHVLRTEGMAEGLAALLQYDPKADAEANRRAMTDAAAGVVSGEVTRAVRDAPTPAGPVRSGDWVGLTGGELVVVEADLADALCALLGRLIADEHELVTVIEGSGACEATTDQVRRWLDEHHPALTVEVHGWGHPSAAYLISIE